MYKKLKKVTDCCFCFLCTVQVGYLTTNVYYEGRKNNHYLTKNVGNELEDKTQTEKNLTLGLIIKIIHN